MMAAVSTLIISDTGMTLGWGTTDSSNMKRGTITESFTEGGFDFFSSSYLKKDSVVVEKKPTYDLHVKEKNGSSIPIFNMD